ncbi:MULTISPECIES: hypothetical protein [Ramlibacter]|uniref:hypothetical protein n=1 Tax=Ramlibacter TaxID=174951 RepID=UPI001D127AEF|nr:MULTISPECIES: hypothetical protein [Ramlibacter]
MRRASTPSSAPRPGRVAARLRPAPWAVLAAAALLGACAGKPPAPDWEMNARGSLDRYVAAWMDGADRAADAEFARARTALAATGQPALVARAELTRCALQASALVVAPCPGFETLRDDAPAAERAYADYLAGHLAPSQADLLPPQHRDVATAAAPDAALAAVPDPLARLVAAGVLMRSGRATPGVIASAVDTAAAQGWRRPLLAWLGVQALRAEAAGDAQAAARIRRRMALAAGER